MTIMIMMVTAATKTIVQAWQLSNSQLLGSTQALSISCELLLELEGLLLTLSEPTKTVAQGPAMSMLDMVSMPVVSLSRAQQCPN